MSARDPLKQLVSAAGGDKPFGEFTVADVEARARELAAATGWGPTAKVGSVARAWSELGRTLVDAGVATVAELDPEVSSALAPKLWVVPPGGSFL